MLAFRRLVWLLPLLLGGCGVDEGSVRATVRFTGTYRDGERFAAGNLSFTPGGAPFADHLAGMRRGERRQVEVSLPDCPGSARFVEFGNPDDGEGVEEQFRYRRDRGPLVFDVELTELCVPTYLTLLHGSQLAARVPLACRGVAAVDSTPATVPRDAATHRHHPGEDLDQALLAAAHGFGKDREAAEVAQLLAAGADPNVADPSGRTALALAADTGNRAIPHLLFLAGARLDGSKFDGPWGVHRAAADAQVEILRALLATGAHDLDALDECGLTPLLWALRNEPSPLFDCSPDFTPDYLGVVVELLERGAEAAVRQGRSSGSRDCVGVYLPTGASPLHYAAAACFQEAVELLLDHGAEADAADDLAETPLMNAARAGCSEVVAVLLDHGARLEAEDGHGGGTALVHAVTRDSFVADNVRTVALLLERGADPRLARERLASWLDSPTGRGFGRKGLRSAHEIARLLKRGR